MELSTVIYDFNLATTSTAKNKEEICSIINNGRKKKIEYQNCINLYNVVEIFNNAYMKYMDDKDEFNNILSNLGEEVVYGHHTITNDFTSLCLDVFRPKPNVFDEKRAIIFLFNNKGNYYGSAKNGLKVIDKKYKSKGINLDEASIKSCLDIVKKHNLFLKCFIDYRNKCIFGDGTTLIFTKIDGDIFDKLSTFTLTFGNFYMGGGSYYMEVKFKLGEKLKILYGKSIVTLKNENIIDLEKKKKIINESIIDMYVHFDNLHELYKQEEKEPILRKKHNNEK